MSQFGFPAQAFRNDRSAGTWVLDPDFSAETEGLELLADGRHARILDAQGHVRAEGLMTADMPISLEREGEAIRLDRIEIGGSLQMYLPSRPIESGIPYTEVKPSFIGARPASPEEIAELPALGAGTMIATDEGPQAIDWLRPGDRILTRDNGYQPLLWLGQHVVPRRSPPETRPLAVPADQFGANYPNAPIIASAALGVLLAGTELELWFAEYEMLARIEHLSADPAPAEGKQMMYTLLFDAPEIVLANGLWVSSVHADPNYISLLPDRVRGVLGPRLINPHEAPARGWMADWEVAMFKRERSARKNLIAA